MPNDLQTYFDLHEKLRARANVYAKAYLDDPTCKVDINVTDITPGENYIRVNISVVKSDSIATTYSSELLILDWQTLSISDERQLAKLAKGHR